MLLHRFLLRERYQFQRCPALAGNRTQASGLYHWTIKTGGLRLGVGGFTSLLRSTASLNNTCPSLWSWTRASPRVPCPGKSAGWWPQGEKALALVDLIFLGGGGNLCPLQSRPGAWTRGLPHGPMPWEECRLVAEVGS